MKTVTYVPGTFVTLVPGPYTPLQRGNCLWYYLTPLFKKREGEILAAMLLQLFNELPIHHTTDPVAQKTDPKLSAPGRSDL